VQEEYVKNILFSAFVQIVVDMLSESIPLPNNTNYRDKTLSQGFSWLSAKTFPMTTPDLAAG
jgi:hypothetical protein